MNNGKIAQILISHLISHFSKVKLKLRVFLINHAGVSRFGTVHFKVLQIQPFSFSFSHRKFLLLDEIPNIIPYRNLKWLFVSMVTPIVTIAQRSHLGLTHDHESFLSKNIMAKPGKNVRPSLSFYPELHVLQI